jgi:hypothetical protein
MNRGSDTVGHRSESAQLVFKPAAHYGTLAGSCLDLLFVATIHGAARNDRFVLAANRDAEALDGKKVTTAAILGKRRRCSVNK